MDTFSRSQRSEIMRRVRSKDTGPEMMVRSMVYRLGFRYRLHSEKLPGHPDLVFPNRRKVVFVHGCFWHKHSCLAATLPKSNKRYWKAKQERNAKRDRRHARSLRREGWKVLVVWECERSNPERMQKRLFRFLNKG